MPVASFGDNSFLEEDSLFLQPRREGRGIENREIGARKREKRRLKRLENRSSVETETIEDIRCLLSNLESQIKFNEDAQSSSHRFSINFINFVLVK